MITHDFAQDFSKRTHSSVWSPIRRSSLTIIVIIHMRKWLWPSGSDNFFGSSQLLRTVLLLMDMVHCVHCVCKQEKENGKSNMSIEMTFMSVWHICYSSLAFLRLRMDGIRWRESFLFCFRVVVGFIFFFFSLHSFSFSISIRLDVCALHSAHFILQIAHSSFTSSHSYPDRCCSSNLTCCYAIEYACTIVYV